MCFKVVSIITKFPSNGVTSETHLDHRCMRVPRTVPGI